VIEPALRQRLVGALVLVALAIVFVPMLIVERREPEAIVPPAPPEPELDIVAEEIVPVDPGPLEPAPLEFVEPPLGDEGAVPESPGADALPGAARPAAGVSAADGSADLPSLEPVDEAPAPSRGEVAERVEQMGNPAAWAVQVASFSSKENADALRRKLEEAGYHAYLDEVAQGDRRLVRVRVGPEVLKSTARRTAEAVADLTGLDPIVVRHR